MEICVFSESEFHDPEAQMIPITRQCLHANTHFLYANIQYNTIVQPLINRLYKCIVLKLAKQNGSLFYCIISSLIKTENILACSNHSFHV